jgi:hypothetical protein
MKPAGISSVPISRSSSFILVTGIRHPPPSPSPARREGLMGLPQTSNLQPLTY